MGRNISYLFVLPLLVGLSFLGCSDFKSTAINQPTVISGRVSLGPVKSGTVTAYSLDSSGGRLNPLGTATTNQEGIYTIDSPSYDGPMEIVLTGGSYTEESSGTVIYLSVGREMRSIIDNVATHTSAPITPLTEIAAKRAKRLIALGGAVQSSIEQAADEVEDSSGVTDIYDNPSNPESTDNQAESLDAQKYALFLAGLSELADNNGTSSLEYTYAFADDFHQDGSFDGSDSGGSITIGDSSDTLQNDEWTTDLGIAIKDYANSDSNTSGLDPTLTTDLDQISAPGETLLVCASPLWKPSKTLTNIGDSFISGGTLILQGHQFPAGGGASNAFGEGILQRWEADSSLVGDFDVTINFADLNLVGSDASFEIIAFDKADPTYYSLVSVNGSLRTLWGEAPTAGALIAPFDFTDGLIQIQRIGDNVTITATVAGNTQFVTTAAFGGSEYGIAFQLRNSSDVPTLDSLSVKILGVTGSLTDNFVCDSLGSWPANSAPTISNIANQAVVQDATTGSLPFSISDAENTLSCATSVSASSSDTTLLPNANIVLAGTAPNCTISLTPASTQSGSSTVQVTVTDGILSTSDSFVLTVASSSTGIPTISDILDQTTNEDTTSSSIVFVIADTDSTLDCNSSLSASSSNSTLVVASNIVFSGTAPNCTTTLTPEMDQSGITTIAITVTDGTNSSTDTFNLVINSVNDSPTISQIADQSINQDTSTGNTAFTIADIDNVLNCSTSISFASSDSTLLPNSGFAFSGTAPNCTVNLTPAAGLSGSTTVQIILSDGLTSTTEAFTLNVASTASSAPSISTIANQAANEDTQLPIPFVVSDADSTLNCTTSLVGTSSDLSLISPAGIVFSGTAPNCLVTITPEIDQSGIAVITLSISDGTNTSTEIFDLTIVPVNDAPIISQIINQATTQDTTTAPIPFTIFDVDDSLNCVTNVTANSFDLTLVQNANIVINGTAPNCTLVLVPEAGQTGSVTIDVTVTDGVTTNVTIFTLTISP